MKILDLIKNDVGLNPWKGKYWKFYEFAYFGYGTQSLRPFVNYMDLDYNPQWLKLGCSTCNHRDYCYDYIFFDLDVEKGNKTAQYKSTNEAIKAALEFDAKMDGQCFITFSTGGSGVRIYLDLPSTIKIPLGTDGLGVKKINSHVSRILTRGFKLKCDPTAQGRQLCWLWTAKPTENSFGIIKSDIPKIEDYNNWFADKWSEAKSNIPEEPLRIAPLVGLDTSLMESCARGWLSTLPAIRAKDRNGGGRDSYTWYVIRTLIETYRLNPEIAIELILNNYKCDPMYPRSELVRKITDAFNRYGVQDGNPNS